MPSPFRTRLATGLLLGYVACFLPAAWRFAAPALSPFLAVCGALTVRSLWPALVCGLPMLVWVMMRRRFWCRRLCPVGLISESCGKMRAARTAVKAAPSPCSWPVARTLALATLGGALAGYPLFSGWIRWRSAVVSQRRTNRADGLDALRRGRTSARDAGELSVSWDVVLPHLSVGRNAGFGGTGRAGPARSNLRARAPGFPDTGRRMLCGAFLPRSSAPACSAAAARRCRRTAFQGGCVRCGSCSRACPAGIIEPAVERHDIAGFLAPQLRFYGPQYCRQDCNVCGRVCPPPVSSGPSRCPTRTGASSESQ